MEDDRKTAPHSSLGRTLAGGVLVALIATIVPLSLATPALAARVKTIKITDASIVEGNSGSQSMTFTVSWSGAKGGGSVSVSYATADISATAGSDYTAKSGSVSLPGGGCKCQTVTVPILGDTSFEGTETLAVNLSGAVNATIGDAQGIGTIYDNEGPPAFVVTDTSADEGIASGKITFTVVMTSSSGGTQTVDYATQDAAAVAGSDYTATSGTLTFTGGQTSKTVDVVITNDSLNEADETLNLILSNGSVTITDNTGVGTILDDDAEPTISVSDASAAENAGPLGFTISLSAASGQEVDVDYATTDGSALAGSDYTTTSGTAVIPAGQTSVEVDVSVLDDATHESDEALTLDLAAPYNASIVDTQGTGTITNDDAIPEASIGDVSLAEGNLGLSPATFDVTLNHPADTTVTVDWATADGTATVLTDYVLGGGTVSFDPGETDKQVSVDVVGDVVRESDESFTVTLSNPNGATLGTATGSATITNDDAAFTALTLKVRKTKTRVLASGVLEMATPGLSVSVSLQKKQGTAWSTVKTRLAGVGALGDRDSDGVVDGTYRTWFKRPAHGRYRVTSVFDGTLDLLPSSKIVTFKL
jgi:hypothetical protein